MLFWLFVIILVVGIGLVAIGGYSWNSEKHHFLWYHDDTIQFVGAVIAVIMSLILVICIIGLGFEFIGVDARVATLNEQYEALTYKLESGACRDEFGLLSKSVIDEIQDWNKDVVYYQNIQNDFWVGIFYADVYEQFETIDYTKYNKE